MNKDELLIIAAIAWFLSKRGIVSRPDQVRIENKLLAACSDVIDERERKVTT